MSGAGEYESRVNCRGAGTLCHRPGVSCKREDLLGELRILAAEMMSRANLLAGDARLLQTRTYAVLLAFAVDAQNRLHLEVCQLRPGWQPGCIAADPVRNTDLERCRGIEPEQADGFDLRLQVGGQPVDYERQYIRAERISNQQHTLFAPARKVVTNDAGHIFCRFVRGALRPEILERVEPDRGHAARRQVRGQLLVEPGPAAVACQEQGELIGVVALGMNLRAVERLIPTSPQAAIALVAEARETSSRALTELRDLVRGIYPPVLADRGLGDAVRALALDTPLRTETDIDLPGRPDAPVESACYFAVAEALANAVKHSGARLVQVQIRHSAALNASPASHPPGTLRITVTDDGAGGADPARGSGLAGIERRLGTFDGILAVSSPPGGPTMIVMEVPCALSSPRTSSC